MAIGGFFGQVIKRLAQGALQTIASAVSYVPGGQAVVSYVSRRFGGLTPPESSQLSGLGYKYETAGTLQTSLKPGVSLTPAEVPIDPTLIGRIPPGNTVQYYLSGRVINPYTGQAKWISTVVNWPDFLTQADLEQMAVTALIDKIMHYPEFANVPGGGKLGVIEINIKGVSRTG